MKWYIFDQDVIYFLSNGGKNEVALQAALAG
jgi:uncharacterized phosphosugar-binding protein